MDIILSWDASVLAMPTQQRTAFEAAVTWAADYWDRTLTNNLTITISVGYGEITQPDNNGVPTSTSLPAGTAEGGPNDGQIYTYAQVEAALKANITSPAATSAYSFLPAADPSNGNGMFVSNLEAEAIGLAPTNTGASGAVGFGMPQAGQVYNFSTTDRSIAGESDFIGIALHELSHALNRLSDIGQTTPFEPAVLDLFRFSGPGQLSSSTRQTPGFSLNGGATDIQTWANGGSDPGDWSGTGGSALTPADSFNAYYTEGQQNYVTATDVSVMSLLGYSVTPNTPRDDLIGHEVSDVLIQNTNGALAVGEVAPGASPQLTYDAVGGLGPEWKFVGAGNFSIDGNTDFLLENTRGAVVLGEVGLNGQAGYTQIGALGPEWSFVATGDFLGDGFSEFLIRNTSGTLDLGSVGTGSTAAYVQIGALGPEWTFVGTGDFLGGASDQFLLQNTNGGVVLGQVGINDQVTYTEVSVLGAEWKFVATGDFLGDGRFDFMIQNTTGALVVGEVSGAQTTYTAVGGLGAEWHVLGAGDYGGTGTDSLLIENTAGAIFTGTVTGGALQYAQIGALGAEWKFHNG